MLKRIIEGVVVLFLLMLVAICSADAESASAPQQPAVEQLQKQVAVLQAELTVLEQQRDQAENQLVLLAGQQALTDEQKKQK
ncbi:MAG: hypothetical protein KGL39_04610 [Patescibacteria group bacterium]|nr:hypothetical protein [Patescibacteria group bacterium]